MAGNAIDVGEARAALANRTSTASAPCRSPPSSSDPVRISRLVLPHSFRPDLCVQEHRFELASYVVVPQLLRRRRCLVLVPATGWFEWSRTPAGKAPYWIRLAGGRPFSLAGLWEAWGEGEGPGWRPSRC